MHRPAARAGAAAIGQNALTRFGFVTMFRHLNHWYEEQWQRKKFSNFPA